MKAKFNLATALLLASTWIACGGPPHNPTVPKFLVAVDGCASTPCAAGTNVNVFPINATTGALGTAVTGAPFNMGLADPMMVEVHPNGKWFYVADGSDGSIHQWDVNESTGVPTDIATKVINESGSFFEPSPNGTGDSPVHVLTVTPNGNRLYSANNDGTVGEYSIGSNGALSHIGDLAITGACDTGAITSNNSYVWVTDTAASGCGSNASTSTEWFIYTLKIGANGSLTKTSSVQLQSVYSWLWSIQINPALNFLYAGDDGGIAQIYGYSVAADGSLTQLNLNASGSPSTMQYPDSNSSDCRFLEHSPDGKFLYWTDDWEYLHAFSLNTSSGAISELSSSPFSVQASGITTNLGAEGQLVADETGKFVYAAEVYSNGTGTTGGVLAFTRDATTGALTMVGATDTSTANSQAVALGIVR